VKSNVNEREDMEIKTKTTSKPPGQNLLKLRQVIERTGLSGTTIWRMEGRGKFPSKVQISENRVGWHEAEIDGFIESRPRVAVAGEV
jgi:prophage regulatory protein